MEHNIQQSLFFDIETTGLSADISAITVIGCCDMDGNVTQWFNEDGLSQKQILTDFLAFIQPYNTLITFNGKAFDDPDDENGLNMESMHHLISMNILIFIKF